MAQINPLFYFLNEPLRDLQIVIYLNFLKDNMVEESVLVESKPVNQAKQEKTKYDGKNEFVEDTG